LWGHFESNQGAEQSPLTGIGMIAGVAIDGGGGVGKFAIGDWEDKVKDGVEDCGLDSEVSNVRSEIGASTSLGHFCILEIT